VKPRDLGPGPSGNKPAFVGLRLDFWRFCAPLPHAPARPSSCHRHRLGRRRNVEFYTRVLGLRLVKKTVNFDDPGPITFTTATTRRRRHPVDLFPLERHAAGRAGAGLTHAIAYSVPAGALAFWRERLQAHGVVPTEATALRFGEPVLAFRDPTDCRSNLVEASEPDPRAPVPHPEISPAHGLRGSMA